MNLISIQNKVYDGDDFPDTYVKVTVTQHMRIVKSKKTSLVRRSKEPSYNQSFDIKLSEENLGVTFLTIQLKQSRLFAIKGRHRQRQSSQAWTHGNPSLLFFAMTHN